jgi:hypothetical protein
MHAASIDGTEITLVISLDELRLLNCALNEVARDARLSDADFEARLGGTREEARALLASINSVLRASEQLGPPRRERDLRPRDDARDAAREG